MGSIRSGTALAADFPIDLADLQRTIDKIDLQAQNSYLSGAGLAQAIAAVAAVFTAYGETAAPPTVAYAGAAGGVNRYYVAVIAYPLTIDPPRPFPYRNVGALPGPPLGGRTAFNVDRGARYSLASTAVEVTGTATTLDATDYVTITAPAYSGVVSGVTFSIVAVNSTGTPLYAVASGVAPGAAVRDTGSTSFLVTGPLPTFPEFAILPATAAGGSIVVSGSPQAGYAAGGLLSADVGGITATYSPVANDTDASAAAGLASAIATAQPLVTAIATGPAIALTAQATGPAGNLAVAVSSTSSVFALSAPYILAGGTAGGPIYGPRTRVSGSAGV